MEAVNNQALVKEAIGYLGPRGTHSEEIALCLFKDRLGEFKPYTSIDGTIRAVENGEVAECVVPIENSVEGSVNITLDTLAHEVNLFITDEIILPIRNNIMVKTGTKHVNMVLSHSQSLAQCRRYLAAKYPGAELKAVESTAEAAYIVASGAKNCAAIGSLRAAEIYGLEVVEQDIQDYANNSTRFIVVSRQPAKLTDGKIKTSVVCQINGERPGSLCEILQELSVRDVNLTKIESRPARTGLGEYFFFLDAEGSIEDENVRVALDAVKNKSLWYKHLGSYAVR